MFLIKAAVSNNTCLFAERADGLKMFVFNSRLEVRDETSDVLQFVQLFVLWWICVCVCGDKEKITGL